MTPSSTTATEYFTRVTSTSAFNCQLRQELFSYDAPLLVVGEVAHATQGIACSSHNRQQMQPIKDKLMVLDIDAAIILSFASISLLSSKSNLD